MTGLRKAAEHGATIVELAAGAGLASAIALIAAAVLVAAVRTGTFVESEATTLDTGRLVAARMQRDVRGSLDAFECEPAGWCLRLYGQAPDGSVRRLRYRAEPGPGDGATVLYRDTDCTADFSSCGREEVVLASLANHASARPVFRCSSSSRHLFLDMTLVVAPLSSSDTGLLAIETSARPRNVATPFC